MCDNYIELVKHQLFNPALYTEQQVKATRWTLHHVGLRILQMYAPYMPHITEAIYAEVYKQQIKTDSIHQTRFSSHQKAFIYSDSLHLAQQIMNLTAHVRKIKTEQQLSLKTALSSLKIYSTDALLLELLPLYENLIRGVTHATDISYSMGYAENPGLHNENDQWHAILNIDKKKE